MLEKKRDNYLIQVESAKTYFLEYNQNNMIERFKLDSDENFIYINFFHERHGINRLTGEVLRCNNNETACFNAIMSIYDILCYSKADAVLSGEWQTLANLSVHSNFGASEKSIFNDEALKFLGKTDELAKACVRLGGIETTKADVGFMFDAFPFLPVIFQYWDGDDEFEPRINILFDKNTLDYIHFETAWYVAGHLIELIEADLI